MGKPAQQINTYQLAGVDERERGFNRQVIVSSCNGSSQAVIRYEALRIEGALCDTDETALGNLIQLLQQRGYTQLRSQLIFQGDRYLGSQELWIEYPDPDSQRESKEGWKGWLHRFLRSPK